MKRIITIIILVFLAAAAWLYFSSGKTTEERITLPPVQEENKPLPAAVQNDLPHMALHTSDGARVEARELQEKVVLVFFLPDCDHCQREAVQIRENIASFKDYSLYFISSAPMEQLNQFATDYKLANYPNIYFARTTIQSVFKNFGPIPTPSLFVYAKGGRMVKAFKGETPIGTILASL